MNDEHPPLVERLLSQMSLQAPSQNLDEAVLKLTGSRMVRVEPTQTGRFGWRSLAATAIVCTAIGALVGSWDASPPAQQTPGAAPPAAGEVPAVATSLRESETIPLHGPAARVIDEGFVLLDGVLPARLCRIVKSRQRHREPGLPIRERIVLPSPEI